MPYSLEPTNIIIEFFVKSLNQWREVVKYMDGQIKSKNTAHFVSIKLRLTQLLGDRWLIIRTKGSFQRYKYYTVQRLGTAAVHGTSAELTRRPVTVNVTSQLSNASYSFTQLAAATMKRQNGWLGVGGGGGNLLFIHPVD